MFVSVYPKSLGFSKNRPKISIKRIEKFLCSAVIISAWASFAMHYSFHSSLLIDVTQPKESSA